MRRSIVLPGIPIDNVLYQERFPELEFDERTQFEQATLPHLDAAYNLARWLTKDEHAAEDIVQEAFYRAARYFGSFRGDNAHAWLLAIVRRTSFDWMSKQRSQSMLAFNDEIHDRGNDSQNPEFLAMRECDLARVREALEELPAQLREVIVLRELEGLSYQEIATVVEAPIGTVMSRLSRGRRQFQERFLMCADGEEK